MTDPMPTTQTEQLLEAILARLQNEFGQQLSIELFPENPVQYRLNHPHGAVLLAYVKSTFGPTQSTDMTFQARSLVLRLTLIFRQLNGKDGVVSHLDRLRDCLCGWYPPNADQACHPIAEQYIGYVNGVWQYAQDYATRATQVQSAPALLTRANLKVPI
ncbi:Gp37 protein [Pseudomonas sp. SJZ085]|uniref:Gp37 family protein n=1 Tax=unclassified Pseudomonas TaxID=196821 RepID=UPI00119AD36E|nr:MULTISPECIES: Gp37 family protein [unclassified Pseudomonas]TWC18634.1 Gp37 protein [Pseudomonas sp. SJZ074]TWC36417.1 Gp37 protein [Pseudomonas sp. SJZ085]